MDRLSCEAYYYSRSRQLLWHKGATSGLVQTVVELMVDVLVRDGRFDVKTASSGYEAGITTEQFRPDLLVLDYMLPDVNGNIVCQTIRSNPDSGKRVSNAWVIYLRAWNNIPKGMLIPNKTPISYEIEVKGGDRKARHLKMSPRPIS